MITEHLEPKIKPNRESSLLVPEQLRCIRLQVLLSFDVIYVIPIYITEDEVGEEIGIIDELVESHE